MGFETSSEMLINMKDIPKWNRKLNYFDQDPYVLEFFENEFKKMTEGVNIGGYFVHPWLYTHLNIFKTPIPQPDGQEAIINPPLDDCTFYAIETYQEAKEKNKIMALFGTRGFTKTTLITSNVYWTMATRPNGRYTITGGEDKDLGDISSLMEKAFTNIHPAFTIPTLTKDWTSLVEFGVKDKGSGLRYVHGELIITNANKGKESASEKGAGGSPIGAVYDEALHEDSLIPTPNGFITMRDIAIGDVVYAGTGEPTKVLSKINPGVVPVYEFTFSDGSKIISSLDHKWKARTDEDWEILRTEEIIDLYQYLTIYFPKLNNKDVQLEYIERKTDAQVYCIGVAHESETFLTENNIVTHNCGKYHFKKILESQIPAFRTRYGFKLVPILSGTSGNVSLAKDAREVLENPAAFDILVMNWDRLNRMVPEEFMTWDKDVKKTFGTFVPGQMSHRLTTPKIKKPFGDYVGSKNKELNKLTIEVTDWEKATKEVQDMWSAANKDDKRNRDRMYYPLSLDDIFLTTSPNPFPLTVIDRRIRELEEEGRIGRSVNIIKDNNKFKAEFVNKRRADVSHRGGIADAPIVVFGEVLPEAPEKYINVSGLDDYKLDTSDTDSLGALYVIKRRNLAPNEPCETIQASYVAKPERHKDFHSTCETIIECWAAECLMESIDVSFEQYLETKFKAEKWLAPAITKSNKSDRKPQLTKKYGMFPTAGNNEYRFNLLVDWCWEEHTIGIDDEGDKLVKLGVEYVDDVDLLKEMRDWVKGKNSDRIAAFSHALVQAKELDAQGIRPKSMTRQSNVLQLNEPQKRSKHKPNNPFGTIIPSGPYSL